MKANVVPSSAITDRSINPHAYITHREVMALPFKSLSADPLNPHNRWDAEYLMTVELYRKKSPDLPKRVPGLFRGVSSQASYRSFISEVKSGAKARDQLVSSLSRHMFGDCRILDEVTRRPELREFVMTILKICADTAREELLREAREARKAADKVRDLCKGVLDECVEPQEQPT